MAEVNPQTGQMGTQNYIGYSERRSGNNAWANLFGSVIGAVDQNNVTNIESSVNQTVSELDQQFFQTDDVVAAVNGEQPEATRPESDPTTMPKTVQDGIKTIDNMAKASSSGALSQGNYSAQLEAKVRSLKAKYPGYVGEIDKAVSRAINAPSANMLRDSIIAQRKANETSVDAQTKSFYTDADKYAGSLGADTQAKIASRSVSMDEMPAIRSMIYELESSDRQRKVDTESLALAKANYENGKISKEEVSYKALNVGKNRVQDFGNRMLFSAGGGTEEGFSKLQTQIFEAVKDGQFDANEQKVLIPEFQKMVLSVNQFKQELLFGKDGIASNLDEKGRKELDDHIDAIIAPVTKAIVGDASALSALSINSTMLKGFKELGQLNLLDTSQGQTLAQIQAAVDLAPSVGVAIQQTYATDIANKKPLGTTASAILSTVTSKIVTTGTPAAAQVKNVAEKAPGSTSAKVTKELLDVSMKALTDPATKPEAKANIVKSFFSEGNTDFLRLFDPAIGRDGRSSQQKVFESLTTSEVKDAIKAMNDPVVMEQYKEWTKAQMFALNKPTIDSAKDFAEFNNYGKVVYDPKSRKFSAKLDPSLFPNEQAMKDFMSGTYARPIAPGLGPQPKPQTTAENILLDFPQFKRVQREIAGLNLHLDRLVPILEASGVTDIDGEISRLTQGLDKDIPKQTRYSYYYNAAIEAAKAGGSAIADYAVPDVLVDTAINVGRGISNTIEDNTGTIADNNLMTPEESTRLNESNLPFNGATNQGPITIPDNETITSAQGSKLTPMEVAKDYLGLTEANDSKVISSFIKKSAGTSINPRVTPWCAAFMNALIGASGGEGTGKLNARSFLEYGTPTETASEGDIVVFSRGNDPAAGHVGLYAGEVTKGGERFIKVLGGNQGDSVSIAEYPASTLLGVRKPPKAGTKLITIE